jgi:type I restriction enzyme R subunit
MTTGVDAKTCKLIVLDANIGSMTEFKQIIGRGTRVDEDYGKMVFTIMDFRNVTDLFADKDFDGEPVMIKVIEQGGDLTDADIFGTEPETNTDGETPPPTATATDYTPPIIIGGGDIINEPRDKIYVAGVSVSVLSERVQHLDADGTLITESLKDYTKKNLLKEFRSLDDFLTRWKTADKKKALIDELEQHGIILENLREDIKKDLDIFDLICHVAWDKPALTRRERANNVRKRDYFAKYSEQAQQVLQALLEKYADDGIENIENLDVLRLAPISTLGRPIEIFNLFGGKEKYLMALKDLETEIYRMAA